MGATKRETSQQPKETLTKSDCSYDELMGNERRFSLDLLLISPETRRQTAEAWQQAYEEGR